MINVQDIYNLTQKSLDASHKKFVMDFNQQADLVANDFLKLREEAQYQDTKMAFSNRLNEFQVQLAQVPRDKLQAINDFELQIKDEFQTQLNLMSEGRRKIFENEFITTFSDLKLKGIQADQQALVEGLGSKRIN